MKTEHEKQLEEVNRVMRKVLEGYVGMRPTPETIAAAEGEVRRKLDEMIKAGTYVLPPNVVLDRVELGEDMRIKVLFKRRWVEGSCPFCGKYVRVSWDAGFLEHEDPTCEAWSTKTADEFVQAVLDGEHLALRARESQKVRPP